MQRYRSVVFIDGDEANEPFEILNANGSGDLFEYLLQWEYGETGEVYDTEPWGTYDNTSDHYDGENYYIVSWNWNLGYVSLTEVLNG